MDTITLFHLQKSCKEEGERSVLPSPRMSSVCGLQRVPGRQVGRHGCSRTVVYTHPYVYGYVHVHTCMFTHQRILF